MCHYFWGHIQPAHLTDSAKLILNLPCVLQYKKISLCISYHLHHVSCWNKTLWSFKSASLCLKIAIYDMNTTSIFVLLTEEYMVPEPVEKENIFRINYFGVCTSIDSVLTPLWSHSLLKCVPQKNSSSNKYVFKAVTHLKLLPYKLSKIFLNCIIWGILSLVYTAMKHIVIKNLYLQMEYALYR